MRSLATMVIIIAMAGFIWFIAFRDKSDADFNKAQNEQSIEAFEEFLKTHADSKPRGAASNALHTLHQQRAWDEVRSNAFFTPVALLGPKKSE